MVKRAIFLTVASSATTVVAAVAGGHPVWACSCATFTDEEALGDANVVFTGTLVEIVTPPGDTWTSTDPERFIFDVDQVYKGEAVQTQTIVTARDGASCGLEIQGPGPFLVYATFTDSIVTGAVDGEFYSNLCSGTRAVADAALPARFGTGRAPTPIASAGDDGADDVPALADRSDAAPTSTSDGGRTSVVPLTVVAIGGAVIVAVVAGLLGLHRRRDNNAPT